MLASYNLLPCIESLVQPPTLDLRRSVRPKLRLLQLPQRQPNLQTEYVLANTFRARECKRIGIVLEALVVHTNSIHSFTSNQW